MNLKEFVDFVVELSEEELYDYLGVDAKTYFLNGGCYEFAKVIKHYVPNSKYVINDESDHCALQYKEDIYDSTGLLDDKRKSEFHIAKYNDILYMEDNFGIPEIQKIGNKKISDHLIDEIKLCNILQSLDFIEDELER